jgi:hypothetical protein
VTSKQATAKIFMTAFRALPREEQNTFLFTIVNDTRFREDIIDMAIAVKRSAEKTKPLRFFLKSLKKRK